jgi:uncharacterized membrane protein (DUF373 family)
MLLAKIQRLTVWALAVMLVVIVLLSTLHLGILIGEEIWKPPRFLISVESLLDVFGYFLLVLIGVELLETLRSYMKKDVIHVRVVLEVALIAMARKAIILEPNAAPAFDPVRSSGTDSCLGSCLLLRAADRRHTEDIKIRAKNRPRHQERLCETSDSGRQATFLRTQDLQSEHRSLPNNSHNHHVTSNLALPAQSCDHNRARRTAAVSIGSRISPLFSRF